MAESLLRLGVWDNKVKAKSYLGHGIYRERAIQEMGPEKFNWIVVGNSIIDWGLNHKKLSKELKNKDINYARMSMGSAKFPAIQMVADWSIQNMPNLEGIIIGTNSTGLGGYNIDTQFKISWPFLKSFDDKKYNYNTTSSDIGLIFKRSALSIFIDDIKNYANFTSKKKRKRHQQTFNAAAVLNFNKKMVGDLCAYRLDNLESCIETTKQLIKEKKLTRFEKSIVNQCSINTSIQRIRENNSGKKLNNNIINQYVNNWSSFLTQISGEVKSVKFILLPEHPLLTYTSKPDNMDTVYDSIFQKVKHIDNIEILDFRNKAFYNSEYKTCELFHDSQHLSQPAKEILTQLLLNSFN